MLAFKTGLLVVIALFAGCTTMQRPSQEEMVQEFAPTLSERSAIPADHWRAVRKGGGNFASAE